MPRKREEMDRALEGFFGDSFERWFTRILSDGLRKCEESDDVETAVRVQDMLACLKSDEEMNRSVAVHSPHVVSVLDRDEILAKSRELNDMVSGLHFILGIDMSIISFRIMSDENWKRRLGLMTILISATRGSDDD